VNKKNIKEVDNYGEVVESIDFDLSKMVSSIKPALIAQEIQENKTDSIQRMMLSFDETMTITKSFD